MKWTIPILCLLMVGCATTQRPQITSPSLGAISAGVSSASSKIDALGKVASDVAIKGAAPGDPRMKAMVKELAAVKADLEKTKAEIAARQGEIDKLTAEMNKVVERLNYLEPKYAASVGIIWKWRMLAIGTWIALAAFFAFRGWLKATFPFLSFL